MSGAAYWPCYYRLISLLPKKGQRANTCNTEEDDRKKIKEYGSLAINTASGKAKKKKKKKEVQFEN